MRKQIYWLSRGCALKFVGPELAIGIPVCLAKITINRWFQKKSFRKHSHSILLLRNIPLDRPVETVLIMCRGQLRQIIRHWSEGALPQDKSIL